MVDNFNDNTTTTTNTNEDINLFCSLICFIPWIKFIKINDNEEEEEEEEEKRESDEKNLNLYSQLPSSSISSSTSSISFSSSDTSHSSHPPIIFDPETSWSVFKSRRRNSGNIIKDFSFKPQQHTSQTKSIQRVSPIGVNDNYFHF